MYATETLFAVQKTPVKAIKAEKFRIKNKDAVFLDAIQDEFEKYWQQQKVLALSKICDEESLDKQQFKSLIESYTYNGQEPIRQDIFKCLENRPSILKARAISKRILLKMKKFIDVFVTGMVG
jgi:type I restriction enzyme R subunit